MNTFIKKRKRRYPKPSQFIPKKPDKYRGDVTNIVIRSNLEKRFALWCDRASAVIGWVSEELIIPYISPIDGEKHRYFVDFRIWVLDSAGKVTEYWVEIKPKAETMPPVNPTRKTAKSQQNLQEAIATFAVNQAKWEAANGVAESKGCKFLIVTDEDLGG